MLLPQGVSVLVVMVMVVIMVMMFCVAFAGGRSRPELRLVLSGESLSPARADETLRLSAIMLCAPVALGFEVCNEINIAQRADVFGNPVLHAPPAVMGMAGLGSL